MNGYDACKQIIDFYDNFSTNFLQDAKNRPINREAANHQAKSVNELIDDKPTKPVMVAFSGLVNDNVRAKAREAGFNIVIESPMTTNIIKSNLLASLQKRSIRP